MANARTSQDTGRNSGSARDSASASGASGTRGRQGTRGTESSSASTQAEGQPRTQSQDASSGSSAGQTQAGGQRGETERQVPVGRDVQRQGSGAVRDRGVGAGSSGGQRGGTPFSFMRRFGEEMDRLFEDFGFAPLGLDPTDLLASPRAGTGAGRSLGSGGAGALTRQPSSRSTSPVTGASWLPQVELLQRGDNLVVRADVPGLKPQDVRVEVDDGVLTLSGERSYQEESEDEGVYHSERAYGTFVRSIPLPSGIDPDDVRARVADGVLEVVIPVPRESRSRRIEVQ